MRAQFDQRKAGKEQKHLFHNPSGKGIFANNNQNIATKMTLSFQKEDSFLLSIYDIYPILLPNR